MFMCRREFKEYEKKPARSSSVINLWLSLARSLWVYFYFIIHDASSMDRIK